MTTCQLAKFKPKEEKILKNTNHAGPNNKRVGGNLFHFF